MIQRLKKFFGIGENKQTTSAAAATSSSSAAPSAPAADGSGSGIERFVDYVVRSLVDHPDSVKITSESTEGATLIKVACEKQDIGKIIGRKGKTISAIRALANGAGGRLGLRVNVEVLD